MPTVKIASKLPDGESNGLIAVYHQLVHDGGDLICAVVMLDTKSLTTDLDNGDVTPTARIRHIEAICNQRDARELARLMVRERERRTGKSVLPLDLEQELRSMLGDRDQGDGDGTK